MHHVTLDRSGTHDRHFNDKVIEFPGTKTRQHVHLRAAFDLEHADGVGVAQHVVDANVFSRHGCEIEWLIFERFHEFERLADAAEHAQAQDIDLHHAQRIDVVLVPFDEVALLHSRRTNRDELIEPVFRQHKTTDML